MKFAFLGYHVEKNWAAMSKSEQDAMIEDCFGYDSKLMKAGHMLNDGTALHPTKAAKTLRWHQGKVLITDGPYTETKEQLGGIGVMEANDMAHAVELMSKHPGLQYGSTFEIRPIDEESLQRQAAFFVALGSNAPAAEPQASKFAAMGYINPSGWDSASPAEREAMFARCIAFDEARVKSGQWLSGIGLQSARTAKTLRAKEGKVVVTDGPYAETKEYLGGIVVLKLKDVNDAVALMSTHPALPFGVVMEIRPIFEEIDQIWETMQRRNAEG